MDNILTVSELNLKLNQVLEARFPFIWVKGEVTNCVKASSGHIYFSLKDNQDLLNCVWFKRYHQDLSFDPLTGECFEEGVKPSLAHALRDGQEIVCAGRLTIYGARGQYQLVIEHAVESGIGQLYEAFENLKRKLASEGLFDTKYKKTIPQHIKNIALITAPTGAVIHDFLRISAQRGNKSFIHIFPSLVQGDDAPEQLIQALKLAQNHIFPNNKKADIIAFIRGGGSIQDLWAFNSEELARAIFACPIPIITGIGHEPDYSIADYVSDKSCATPSHVSQFLWKERDILIQELDDIEYTIKTYCFDIIKHLEREYQFLVKGLHYVSPKTKLIEKSMRLVELQSRLHLSQKNILQKKQYVIDSTQKSLLQNRPQLEPYQHILMQNEKDLYKNIQTIFEKKGLLYQQTNIFLQNYFKQYLKEKEQELEKLSIKLQANNPKKPLEKGYLYAEKIYDGQTKVIKSIQDLQKNDILKLHISDGTVETFVQTISPHK